MNSKKLKYILIFISIFISSINLSYGMAEDDALESHATRTVALADIQKKAEDFDKFMFAAVEEKYPPGLWETMKNRLKRWSPRTFIDTYTKSAYPEDRLNKLIYHLMDIQLEFWFIEDDFAANSVNPVKPHFLLLRRLSFDQSLILKSRILWERIMNFVYFLETGKDLEVQAKGKKSKKGAFFDFVKTNNKWSFLGPYHKTLSNHDDRYRTAEAHKGSVLRKEIFTPMIDSNSLLRLFNDTSPVIWDNLLLIIMGEAPRYFTDVQDYLKESWPFEK